MHSLSNFGLLPLQFLIDARIELSEFAGEHLLNVQILLVEFSIFLKHCEIVFSDAP